MISITPTVARCEYSRNCRLSRILTHNGLHRTMRKTKKASSEQQFCGKKSFVDERGQRRMSRLVWADRKTSQIATLYNRAEQKSIIRTHNTCWTSWQMGYKSRRPDRVPLPSAKNRKPWAEVSEGTRSPKLDRAMSTKSPAWLDALQCCHILGWLDKRTNEQGYRFSY